MTDLVALAPWVVVGLTLVILALNVAFLSHKLGKVQLSVSVQPEAKNELKAETDSRRNEREPKAEAEPKARVGRPPKDQSLLGD